jgi:FAD synthase
MAVVSGQLVGRSLGNKIGFPTLNYFFNGEERGVFAALIYLDELKVKAAVNIGGSPTLSKSEIENDKTLCEVHLLLESEEDLSKKAWQALMAGDFDLNLVKKIRDTEKFANIDLLKKQIALDIEKIKLALNEENI